MEVDPRQRIFLTWIALMSIAASLSGCTYRNAWYMHAAVFTEPGEVTSQSPTPWHAVVTPRVPGIPALFIHLADAAGARYHVDPILVLAVCQQESSFNPRAVSSDGAEGLMQLMPDTAARMGVIRPFDPAQAIYGGTRYLALLLAKFHDDLRLTLAAYNEGPATIAENGYDISPTAGRYVDGVLAKYRALRTAEGFHDAD